LGSIDDRISLKYDIDGIDNGDVPLNSEGFRFITTGAAQISLPELTDGSHCLTLYLYGFNQKTPKPQFMSYINTVYFTVDATPPKIVFFSPKHATYTEADIPLNFTLNEQVSSLTYSLDGNSSVAIDDNCTLAGLTVGLHNVTVNAVDVAGNRGNSATVQFKIAKSAFPTTTIDAAVASAALLVIAFLVYLKIRKRIAPSNK
jgi:hypothetical protein